MANPSMPEDRKHQKERVPYFHYLEKYGSLDPLEIASRCAIKYETSGFQLRLLGKSRLIPHPAFDLITRGEPPVALSQDEGEMITAEKTLVLRYLCEGKYIPPQGQALSYNEVPWGPVYYRNFEGRCLKRLAFSFGKDIPAFKRVMEDESFRAEKINKGDAGYRMEFINGLFITLILWAADDEFPPSAQILFDDNLPSAFTAEDLAVVGETVIAALRKRAKELA